MRFASQQIIFFRTKEDSIDKNMHQLVVFNYEDCITDEFDITLLITI